MQTTLSLQSAFSQALSKLGIQKKHLHAGLYLSMIIPAVVFSPINSAWAGTTGSGISTVSDGTFNQNGDFVDGLITWKKTTANKYTYDEAAKYCSSFPADIDNSKWHLATSGQLEIFWGKTMPTRLRQQGWSIGNSWVRDEPGRQAHGFVEFEFGAAVKFWQGKEVETNHAFCVKYPNVYQYPVAEKNSFYSDGKTGAWSEPSPGNSFTQEEAAKYCDSYHLRYFDFDKKRTWALPTEQELITFFSNSAQQRILDSQDWVISGSYWTSTTDRNLKDVFYSVFMQNDINPGEHVFSTPGLKTNKLKAVCIDRNVNYAQELKDYLFSQTLHQLGIKTLGTRRASYQSYYDVACLNGATSTFWQNNWGTGYDFTNGEYTFNTPTTRYPTFRDPTLEEAVIQIGQPFCALPVKNISPQLRN